ncbi:MAG: hypothetical protein IK997_03245 [Bacilli bacterium]|nr:hypothetical protein [Bacilli bacterium]
MKKKSFDFCKFYKKIWINKKYRKVFLTSVLGIFTIILLIIVISNSHTLTSIEERELKKNSEVVMGYMEEIENVKKVELSSYIIYAMEYNYNENDKTTLSLKNMVKLLENVFNKKFNEKELEKIGITPDMLSKNITYDFSTKKYVIDKGSYSYADIAQTKIVKYELQKIKKNSKNKFTGIYRKYVVSNPYEVLNYYDALNSSNNIKSNKKANKVKKYDTTDIFNYLTGKEKLKVMKKYITNESAKKVAKDKGEIEVKYIISGDKILVKEIKSDKNKIEY